MRRADVELVVSILLLLLVVLAGASGYVQSQLELRRFVPHQHFAYATLILAAIHVALNVGKMGRYLRRRFRGNDLSRHV
jgi:hypothetical protein